MINIPASAQRDFGIDAVNFLSRFQPRLDGSGSRAAKFAIPLGFGTSANGYPTRQYRDPLSGRILVFGLDRSAWARGQFKPVRLV